MATIGVQVTEYRCDIPVLLLVFNRPEAVKKAVQALEAVRPYLVYVAADGPREGHPDDPRLCEQARGEALKAGEWAWDCEVRTLFRDQNIGVRDAVSGAIDWFFEREERGIVLEDDCVATPSFFRFCGELLDKYEENDRIMSVSGHNVQPERRTSHSYYFSGYFHSGAWATWRRAWRHYEPGMEGWGKLRDEGLLEGLFGSRKARRYWRTRFNRVYEGEIGSWAYVWQYSIWKAGGINILPEVNLVRNIGFGEDATNTKGGETIRPLLTAEELDFPLDHPERVEINREADRYTQFRHYQTPLLNRALRKVRRLFT